MKTEKEGGKGMYISDSAIKKLQIYLVLMSIFFILIFILTISVLHIENLQKEYFLNNMVKYEEYRNLLTYLYYLIGFFIYSVAIMIFILTGIILCIRRFKMKRGSE